jgi:hypothetical protein
MHCSRLCILLNHFNDGISWSGWYKDIVVEFLTISAVTLVLESQNPVGKTLGFSGEQYI